MKSNFLIVMCFIAIFLSSCSPATDKETAYSFSMVFEKENGTPKITMYCKTAAKEMKDGESLQDNQIHLTGTSFENALESVNETDFDVYCKSTKAVFFSDDIKKEEKTDIITYFFNHTKFQSDVYIYSPETISTDIFVIHEKASEVCKSEKIPPSQKKQYISSVKEVRKICDDTNYNFQLSK